MPLCLNWTYFLFSYTFPSSPTQAYRDTMVVETGKEDLIDYEDPADLEQSEEQEEDEEIAVQPVPTVPPKKVRNLPPHVF